MPAHGIFAGRHCCSSDGSGRPRIWQDADRVRYRLFDFPGPSRIQRDVDEPWRLYFPGAGRLCRHGKNRRLPDCSNGLPGEKALWRAVPPGSAAHRRGQRNAPPVPLYRLRRVRRLDDGRLPADRDPLYSGKGRFWPRAAGAVRRRRFLCRCSAYGGGYRQPAHLCVC